MADYPQGPSILPSLRTEGPFVALPPFDQLVKPNINYKVEQISTIRQLQSEGDDLYKLMFKPLGVSEEDYPTVLERSDAADGTVIILTSRNHPPVYLLSTFLKSAPMPDGVVYERICWVVDGGAVPPQFLDTIHSASEHFKNYILSTLGIETTVHLSTIPTREYVSKEQADVFESTRQQKITQSSSDVVRLRAAEEKIAKQAAYIAVLEQKVADG